MKTVQKKGYMDRIASIVGVYAFAMLAVFPLFVTHGYSLIHQDKLYFFWISAAVTAGLCLVIGLAGVLSSRREKPEAAAPRPDLRGFIRRRLCIADWFFLLFMLVVTVSTLFCRWPYEAFWGTMGRLQGMFAWIWYAVEYILISRFFRFRPLYLKAFAAAGIVVSLWAGLDTLGFDPAGWRSALLLTEDRYVFTSTYGNINLLTGALAVWLGVLSVLFVDEKESRGSAVFYFISFMIVIFGLIMGRSDNSILSLAFILCFLPFYAWKNRRGFLRYLFLLSGTAAVFFLIRCFVGNRIEQDYHMKDSMGVLLKLACGKSRLVPVCFLGMLLITAAAVLLYYFRLKKETGNAAEDRSAAAAAFMDQPLPFRARTVWAVLGCLALAAAVFVLIDANTGGHPQLYGPYSNILIFSDEWGTHRGFNWKLLLGHFRAFDPFHLLFGAGPETYGIYTRVYDFNYMKSVFNEVYDVPHNELLQYLFNTGFLGVIGYYGTVVSSAVLAFHSKVREHSAACAAAFGVLAFTAQSVVNISTPMVLPTVILFIALSVNLTGGVRRVE